MKCEIFYPNLALIQVVPGEKGSAKSAYIWVGKGNEYVTHIDNVKHLRLLKKWCDVMIKAKTKRIKKK